MSRTYRNNRVGEKAHHRNAIPYTRVSRSTNWLEKEEELVYKHRK